MKIFAVNCINPNNPTQLHFQHSVIHLNNQLIILSVKQKNTQFFFFKSKCYFEIFLVYYYMKKNILIWPTYTFFLAVFIVYQQKKKKKSLQLFLKQRFCGEIFIHFQLLILISTIDLVNQKLVSSVNLILLFNVQIFCFQRIVRLRNSKQQKKKKREGKPIKFFFFFYYILFQHLEFYYCFDQLVVN